VCADVDGDVLSVCVCVHPPPPACPCKILHPASCLPPPACLTHAGLLSSVAEASRRIKKFSMHRKEALLRVLKPVSEFQPPGRYHLKPECMGEVEALHVRMQLRQVDQKRGQQEKRQQQKQQMTREEEEECAAEETLGRGAARSSDLAEVAASPSISEATLPHQQSHLAAATPSLTRTHHPQMSDASADSMGGQGRGEACCARGAGLPLPGVQPSTSHPAAAGAVGGMAAVAGEEGLRGAAAQLLMEPDASWFREYVGREPQQAEHITSMEVRGACCLGA
jgi:hypothetical protein